MANQLKKEVDQKMERCSYEELKVRNELENSFG